VTTSPYVGDELELFARAANWKAYWSSVVAPHLRGHVLEVGAGLGVSTDALRSGGEASWTCLEPDAEMAAALRDRWRDEGTHAPRVVEGTVQDLPLERAFDAALYVDVLEHIDDHWRELEDVCARLRAGGVLVVVSPAHGFLFSRFDRAIGHHRRYDRRSLGAVVPTSMEVVDLRYLDAVGLLANLANRLLLRKPLPNHRDIALWDRVMVPISRSVDPLLRYRVGKSVVGVWRSRAG